MATARERRGSALARGSLGGMPSRRLAAALLALEGGLGLAWAGALATVPELGGLFLPDELDPSLLRTFVLADLVFYGALPIAAAAGITLRRAWGRTTLLLHAGAAWYALLWGLGWVVLTGAGGVAVGALLAPPALLAALLVVAPPTEVS